MGRPMKKYTVVDTIGFLTFLAMLAIQGLLTWVNFGLMWEHGTSPFNGALIGLGYALATLVLGYSWRRLVRSDAYRRMTESVAMRLHAE
jgi:hypothetical protein